MQPRLRPDARRSRGWGAAPRAGNHRSAPPLSSGLPGIGIDNASDPSVMMGQRLWDMLLLARATVGALPLILAAAGVLYGLYVIKMKLGIDIFPRWGLHLPGPRALLREIIAIVRE